MDLPPATEQQVSEIVARYPELRDAVRIAMMKALRAGSDDKEWGGAIFQRGNEFYASDPQSSGGKYGIGVHAKRDQPDDILSAIYHTHPKGKYSERFSPDDVRVAQSMKVPSFVGVAQNGNVIAFDPATDKPDRINPRMRNPNTDGAARGRTYLLAEALRMAQK